MSQASTDLDVLSVVGLRARGHHGVLDHERRDGQDFLVDVDLGADLRPAGRSDLLQDTIDYGSLSTRIVQAVENDPVDLIETLAQRIADLCLADDRVRWARVTVHKPHAPIKATFTDVAVTLTRSRDD